MTSVEPVLMVISRTQVVDKAAYLWFVPARPCKVGVAILGELGSVEAAPGVLCVLQNRSLQLSVPYVIRVDPAATVEEARGCSIPPFAFTGPLLPPTQDLGDVLAWLRHYSAG